MDNETPEKYIERLILEALADIRLIPYEELLEKKIQNDGDLDVTAKEESFIIPWIEDKTAQGVIITAKDFNKRKQSNCCLAPLVKTTVNDLRDLVVQKIQENAIKVGK